MVWKGRRTLIMEHDNFCGVCERSAPLEIIDPVSPKCEEMSFPHVSLEGQIFSALR